MNYTGFFEAIKAGNIANLYLLEGTEEYIKQQALHRLCEKALPKGLEQMNLTRLHNPDADELIAAAETLPFMGERRVVIAEDFDLLIQGRKQENEGKAEAMLAYLPGLSPGTCLVFMVRGKADGRKRLYTYLKKAGAIVDFSPMNDEECARWAQRSMRAMGKALSPNAAAQLVFTVGRDAALLRQEMDKLRDFTAGREEVAPADIEAICTKSLECTVFQMVDAQVAGRYEEAFSLMNAVLRSGEDRMMILSMLLRQYRILYHMSCLLQERVPQQAQGGMLGIPPFAVGKTQAQARRYSPEKLRAAYEELLNTEYQIKTGRIPQEGCAEGALLRLKGILAG